MVELQTADLDLVLREAEAQLEGLVDRVWHHGWQPAALARHARRHDPHVGRVVAWAATFTAKAQELMARHAIDAAVLWSRSARKARPITIRLPIDDLYADQKSLLLQVVAEHSQCKAVSHGAYGLQSVIGFAADVAATELLFTSLLVQSHAALQAEAASAPPGSRVRGRSFRASFLVAYANRIDGRLGQINDAVRESAVAEHVSVRGDAGPSLLPALVARRDAVDDEVGTFGRLVLSPVGGGNDALGWARGRLAADRAPAQLVAAAPLVAAAAAPSSARETAIQIAHRTESFPTTPPPVSDPRSLDQARRRRTSNSMKERAIS